MELNILHLYPDSMSLYGEWANLAILCRHLEALDVAVTVEKVTGEDTTDFTRADMIYMGAGTEGAQKAALLGLARHAGELKAAVDRGALLLFTGSAMETLGASVTDAAGKVWQGLALADFTTVETDKRSPGDVIAASTLWEAPAVGFMNKCSLTHGVTTPLFSSLSLGFGNDQEGGGRGLRQRQRAGHPHHRPGAGEEPGLPGPHHPPALRRQGLGAAGGAARFPPRAGGLRGHPAGAEKPDRRLSTRTENTKRPRLQ